MNIPLELFDKEHEVTFAETSSLEQAAADCRVLIIDDTVGIHGDFRKILCAPHQSPLEEMEAAVLGITAQAQIGPRFVVDSAYQGQEGLKMVDRAIAEGLPYALAFVDVRMPPGWDGIETVSRLWASDPDLQVVICTAYSDYSWHEMSMKFGRNHNFLILKKPFDTIEVLQMVHALAQKWALSRECHAHVCSLNSLVDERTRELQEANQKLLKETQELKEAEKQLRQAQKMEAVGQLAGGVAHDFNNLLCVIRGCTDLVLLDPAGLKPEALECLKQVVTASEAAANLTRQLLVFSRKQPIQSQALNLTSVIRNMMKMLKRIIGEDIHLDCVYETDLPSIDADTGMIEQVLANLVVNARDAMPRGGRLTIATESVQCDEAYVRAHSQARTGSFVCLSVTDNGTGIAPEHLSRIFEPFFTTKEVGKGTGLGLATVYGIVQQHRGWIEVSSRLGSGSTFRILLPALASNAAAPTSTAPESAPRGQGEHVLLVEDDEAVRRLTRRLLESLGYRVQEANSGREALEHADALLSQIDLLLTDIIMPGGINGRELADKLRARRPGLKVLFMSGYSGNALTSEPTSEDTARIQFLQKPCSGRELGLALRHCLEGRK